jgi:hypothetical protein
MYIYKRYIGSIGYNPSMVDSHSDEIENVLNNPSWFREHSHYWATVSLPLAYAVACVEVVSKMSGKAG